MYVNKKQQQLTDNLSQAKERLGKAREELESAQEGWLSCCEAFKDLAFIREQLPSWLEAVKKVDGSTKVREIVPELCMYSIYLHCDNFGVFPKEYITSILLARLNEDPAPLKSDTSFSEYLESIRVEILDLWAERQRKIDLIDPPR